uniref:Uncharacterized protein n=1 Tax=Physcomitrium patens TaxID=3218 RepID=A0A2K1KX07_PHYPA|nr:hypothetical protein PHYPA_005319 [Physcomitrium patens]
MTKFEAYFDTLSVNYNEVIRENYSFSSYSDGQYWTMWKPRLVFGCQDAAQGVEGDRGVQEDIPLVSCTRVGLRQHEAGADLRILGCQTQPNKSSNPSHC